MFQDVNPAPPVKVFQLTAQYLEDQAPVKYNLGVGAYRTNEGKPYILESVRQAEERILADNTLTHEYLPIDGLKDFTDGATALIFGKEHPMFVQRKYVAVQSLSGTGAICLAAVFMKQCLKKNTVYISSPTWPNHRSIFMNWGFENIKEYRYWDKHNKCLDFQGMIDDLQAADKESVVILHSAAHNPTGCDPSREHWDKVLDVVKERQLIPLFDSAYLGFASGSFDNDSYPLLAAVDRNIEGFICQSFAKNFGLYDCRIGNLIVVNNNIEKSEAIRSQLKRIARFIYSNPPSHGARIIAMILNDPNSTENWKREVEMMSNRIKEMRHLLYDHLKSKGISWDHIITQIGLFAFTGLTAKQVAFVKEKYHIYMMDDGRINVCALTTNNVQYIADAFYQATQQCS